MATVSPIKFRCFQCQKLLGVSRAKAGQVVACPRCSAELIVPDPPDAVTPSSTSSSSDGERVSASRVSPGVVPWDAPPEPESGTSFPMVVTEPISLRPDPPAYFKTNARPVVENRPITPPHSGEADAPASPESFPVIAGEPMSIREEPVARSAPPLAREVLPRRSDVVLPRTAATLGSFLILLGMIFAFATGLLVGRFIWAPGVKIASSLAPPAVK